MRIGIAAFFVSALITVGCSSGRDAQIAQQETEFEGSATKGPFDSGMLRIDDERGGMHMFPIGSDSRFSGVVAGDGSFTCRAYDGGFIDEATGLRQTVAEAFALYGIFFAQRGNRVSLNLSVLTTLVFWRMQFLLAARPGLPANDAYSLACKQYELLGFGSGSPIPAPTAGSALSVWLLAVALSQMAAAQGVPTAEIAHWFAVDGMDGRFDGYACGKRVLLSNGTYPVDALIDMKNKMLNFLESNPNNTSTITETDPTVLALCDTIDAHLDGDTGVLDDPPLVQDAYPSEGSANGGEMLRLKGIFDGSAITTRWEHVDGTTSTVPGSFEDESTVVVTAPPGPLGIAWVEVEQQSTGLFDTFQFRYTPPVAPITVLNLFPANGPLLGGTLVKVTGSGFRMSAPPTVTFGGLPGTIYRVASDTCLYVFTPEGTAPGSVPVVVGGVGGTSYQFQDPLVRTATTAVTLWDGGTVLIGGIIEAHVGLGNSSTDQFTLGNSASVDREGGMTETQPLGGSPAETGAYFLDEFESFRTLAPGDGGGTSLQGPPESRVGIQVLARTSTVAPNVDGDYFVTGLCTGAAGDGTLQGKATFDRARGRLFVRGLISTRPRDGGEPDSLNPVFAGASYSVASNGRLTASGFDAAAGITLADGFVTPDGGHGMLMLVTEDSIYTLLIGRCPTGIADFGATNLSGASFELPESGALVIKANDLVSHRDGLHQRWRCDMRCRLDPFAPPLPKFEYVTEDGYYVDGFGVMTSKKGRKIGFLTEGGIVLTLPGLPFWGFDGSGDFDVDPGFGAWSPVTPYYTSKSIRSDYKVLATGIELGSSGVILSGIIPNPYERTTQILGCARPVPSEVINVCDEPFALATKFEFDVLKDKRVTRDEERNVSVEFGMEETLSGYAFTFIANQLIAIPCPFDGETFCIFKGYVVGGGDIGFVSNAEGINASWCGTLVRKSTVAPPATGNYDLRFLLTQADPDTGDLFAANGQGSVAFGSGTFAMNYTQFSVREDLFSGFPTGPFGIPGTFTVDDDGCVELIQDFGPGAMFPLCGMATRNGGAIFLMDPADAAISVTYALVRTDAVTGQVPFAGTQLFCGLELDFLGSGAMQAATRMGVLTTRTAAIDLTLDRVLRTNLFPGFERQREMLLDLSGSFSGRSYGVTAPGNRAIDGAIGTYRPGVGAHTDRQAETSLDVSAR